MELKEKEATSYSFGTQFEPSVEPVKRPLDDNEGIIIVETALSAEQPVEEEGVCMYKRNLVSVHYCSLKMHRYQLLFFFTIRYTMY